MENKWPQIHITKLEAARRQLRTAINLFFEDADDVSIHTLAAASHEILRTLLKSRGDGGSLLKDNSFIRAERQKEFEQLLNKPQNFFKHASRDPDEALQFLPKETVFWLCDGIMMESCLTKLRFSLAEFHAFIVWFSIEYTELLNDETLKLIPIQIHKELPAMRNSAQLKKDCWNSIMNPKPVSTYRW
jgi:hypothetical protein